MTPDEREAQRQAFADKNAARKAGRSNREARELRRSYRGAFGREKFGEEGGTGQLIKQGTRKS